MIFCITMSLVILYHFQDKSLIYDKRRSMPVEICSGAAQLYKKITFEKAYNTGR